MVLGTAGLPPREAAWRLVTASWITHAVRAMAVLGLADHLADGPRTAGELAEATHADPRAMADLLRALAGLGLLQHDEAGRARLTPVGECLRADAPGSLRPAALTIMAPYMERAWHELPEAVRTGAAVFPRVHGVGFWDYLAAHPEEEARFDAAMTSGADARARALLAARDLAGLGTLVDVGGGEGRLLAVALAATPGLRGGLFDRPEVLPRAEAYLGAAGVRERCKLVGGDFLRGRSPRRRRLRPGPGRPRLAGRGGGGDPAGLPPGDGPGGAGLAGRAGHRTGRRLRQREAARPADAGELRRPGADRRGVPGAAGGGRVRRGRGPPGRAAVGHRRGGAPLGRRRHPVHGSAASDQPFADTA
jgi:hypothetical protein